MDLFLSFLMYVGIVILTYMTFLYFLSLILRRSDIVDIGWGIGFILITVTMLLLTQNISTTLIVVSTMVVVWALRLITHIFLRNRDKKEDFRYQNFRDSWGKNFWWKSYINTFLLQGVLMILISIPVIYQFSYPTPSFIWLNYIGIALWIFGFLFETLSDYQLSKFLTKKKTGKSKEKFLKSGLWSLSRHPNYFGEVTLWWGVWLTCISFTQPLSLLTIIGPITITYFIVKVSGVPMLEKKYAGDKEWEEYKKKVPTFIPLKLK